MQRRGKSTADTPLAERKWDCAETVSRGGWPGSAPEEHGVGTGKGISPSITLRDGFPLPPPVE
ncbi:hypothetical protein K370107A2_16790 [Merdimmobilis hominis]